MIYLNIENITYDIAIMAQVSGAILLLVFGMSVKRKSILRQFFTNRFTSKDGDTRVINYNENALAETYRSAYNNKISVALIGFGYLVGIFGKQADCKIYNLLIITFGTLFIMFLSNIIVGYLTKRQLKNKITEE